MNPQTPWARAVPDRGLPCGPHQLHSKNLKDVRSNLAFILWLHEAAHFKLGSAPSGSMVRTPGKPGCRATKGPARGRSSRRLGAGDGRRAPRADQSWRSAGERSDVQYLTRSGAPANS